MQLIAWKDGTSGLLIDPEEIGCLHRVAALNEDADNAYELYAPLGGPPSILADVVLSPSRAAVQEHLRNAVEKIENQ